MVLFFSLNSAIAAWTALSGDLALWGLYNGFIAYLLIGSLYAVERVIRHFVRKRSDADRGTGV